MHIYKFDETEERDNENELKIIIYYGNREHSKYLNFK